MFCISGVFGENWNVTYETESICALKGSTVNMSCSYTYPQQYDLTDTFWIKMPDVEIKSLKEYPEYKDRVEYIEDRQRKTAVLRLHNITENDERMYCFRLITENKEKKWIGKEGIHLNVSGNPLLSSISIIYLTKVSSFRTWLERSYLYVLKYHTVDVFLQLFSKGTTAGAGERNSQSDL